MNLIKVYGKTIVAFVAGVAGNMIVQLINGSVPWPQTTAEWLQFAITSFGVAIAVLISPANKITQKQLDNDPNVIGGVVVPDAQIPTPPPPQEPPGGYPSPWPKPSL